ncbi:MAG: hypothetical protein ABI193_22155 [Minicystis sp.]
MIARERLSSEDLIQLPRFDSVGAVALGDRLLAVPLTAELPRPLQKVREDLIQAHEALRAATTARLAEVERADPEAAASSDDTLDNAWTALFEWLTGFSKLPDGTLQAEESRTLLAELYPEGLTFLDLPYELEWSESDGRLRRLADEPLGDRIRALGGQPFFDALTAAHREYGKVLGLRRKGAGKGVVSQPAMHEALYAFTAALRVYALKVTAHVDVEEAETAALANALLKPLLSWRSGPGPG